MDPQEDKQKLTINVKLFKKLYKENLKELEQVFKDLGAFMKIEEIKMLLNNEAVSSCFSFQQDKAKSHQFRNSKQCRGGGVVIALASRS